MNQINLSTISNNNENCIKCHGREWYPVNEKVIGMIFTVEVKCEFCCKHNDGFTKLSGPNWGMLNGFFICKSGCGFIKEKTIHC